MITEKYYSIEYLSYLGYRGKKYHQGLEAKVKRDKHNGDSFQFYTKVNNVYFCTFNEADTWEDAEKLLISFLHWEEKIGY